MIGHTSIGGNMTTPGGGGDEVSQVEGTWSQPVTRYRRSLDKGTREGGVNITHFLQSKLSSNGLTLSQLCFYKNYARQFNQESSDVVTNGMIANSRSINQAL